MSSKIIFRKNHFIVVRSYTKEEGYYTIINTKTGKHSHVYKDEIVAAMMICKCAFKNLIPDDYPRWMKESIRRIQDDRLPVE